MTLTTQSIKSVAVTNGATTVWPFNFIIPDLASLVFTVVDSTSGNEVIISPVNYTVTGLGNPAGGTVTYPTSGGPLAAGSTTVIERFVAEVQQTDLINQGGAYPQDIEDALDYQTMISQQLQDQVDRSIVFSVADTVAQTLPLASARANLLLGFNSSGAPIAVAGIVPNVQVSAPMIPVVTAPSTAAALAALGLPGALLDTLIPAGTAWPYTLTAAPTGFVFPFGQPCTSLYPVYRAALVAAGNPYGTNGVDPLMPDFRSAVPAGKSNMGGSDNGLLTGGTVLGAVLGTQTKVLLTSNLPAYTPTGTITNGAITSTATGGFIGGTVNQAVSLSGGATTIPTGSANVLVGSVQATTTFTGTAQGGSSSAFSIVQPTFICNYILKVH